MYTEQLNNIQSCSVYIKNPPQRFKLFKVILRSFGAIQIIDNFVSRNRLVVEDNMCNLGLWALVAHTGIWGTFEVIRFKSFKVLQCTFFKMACISKTVCRRAKVSEIWDLWILVIHTWAGDTFHLAGFRSYSETD